MSPLTSFCVYTTLTTFRPDLSLFALECINLKSQQRKGPSSTRLPGSLALALSDLSMSSSLSTLTFTSEATVVSKHGPDEYERL